METELESAHCTGGVWLTQVVQARGRKIANCNARASFACGSAVCCCSRSSALPLLLMLLLVQLPLLRQR